MNCIRCAAPPEYSKPTSCRSPTTTLSTCPTRWPPIKELTTPAGGRAILAYEEAHKNRQGVVSAAQTRAAAIAQEVVGID
jgi:hypothetical protein